MPSPATPATPVTPHQARVALRSAAHVPAATVLHALGNPSAAAALSAVSLAVNSPQSQRALDPIARLLEAIAWVESRGRTRAVGDRGRARGILQIHKPAWLDAIRYGRVNWPYERYVWSRPHAEQVARWYWQRYAPEAYRTGNLEVLARIWNGGPRGHRRRSTLSYWRRVRAALRSRAYTPTR